jgi:plasmid maintenance system antidote protein VapI
MPSVGVIDTNIFQHPLTSVALMPTLTAMQHGRVQLRAWIDRMGLTDRAAAKLLGIHWTFLSQILNRPLNRAPGLRTAIKIERTTGIPVEAWMPTDDGAEPITIGRTPVKARSGRS